MSQPFAESAVEQPALAWLAGLGGRVTHGLEIAPGESMAGRFIGMAV